MRCSGNDAQSGQQSWLSPDKIYVVFCPEKLAIIEVSGIITTNLGKPATLAKIAGREKTDTSLQNMPFSLNGGGHFFCMLVLLCLMYKKHNNHVDTYFLRYFNMILMDVNLLFTGLNYNYQGQCCYRICRFDQ